VRRLALAIAASAALVVPCTGLTTTLPTSFQESTVLSGLSFPTAVRFAPDGRVFVAEQSGIIKVFPGLGGTPTIFADLTTEVQMTGDRGLLGLALDPNFPIAPYVYALYTRDAPIGGSPPTWGDDCPTPPGPQTNGCMVSGRLVRLTADGNISTGTQVLLDGWCQQFTSHSIGDLHFGPDGALYASGGDGASYTFADYGQTGSPKNPCGDPPVPAGGNQQPPGAEGGALRSQSLRRPAGQPAALNGSILRVDPTTGAARPDNPLAGSSDPNARRIIAYGMRNPFRFTFRPGTNELWIGDVGWTDWEEIDRAPNPTDSVVENFGWPCYEGNGPQSGYQSANLSLCQGLYNAGTAVPPFYTYNHADKVVPGESCQPGGSAISGMAFYNSNTYPTSYSGTLFFADYARNCIWAMGAGANGVPDPTKITTFGAGASTPVDLEIGPNGDLFYVDIGGGTVREIKYLGANRAPIANATATPTSGSAPLTVSFDGSASSDPDPGDTITYSWDLNGDGVFGDSTVAKPTYTYQTPGSYSVRLRVTDNHLATTTSNSITISASNSPPVPAIQTPQASLTWKVGDPISFSGSATDAQDGTLPASALSWTVLIQHCPSTCHTHFMQSMPGVASGIFNAPDHDYPSYLTLQLTATDSTGTSTTTSIDLQPKTVQLSFYSSPSGLKLTVGPTASTTPFTRTVIVNSQNSISATTPQPLAGTVYDFASWSDGGAQTHTIVAGSSPASYTANYVVSQNQTDITPPTVVTTAPAPNATVSGNVTLTANASDDVGVTGVQFQVDGMNLGVELQSAPYSTQWNAAGLPNGIHTISAVARDAVGHTTQSTAVTVYVANGLVGAWAFDEGSGTSLADSSGNSNTGTAAGTTWTTGKYGGALTFNGAPTSWATAPDNNSLDLSNASTLEAWVYPTALGTGWRTVLFKEKPGGMVYSLYANNGTPSHPLGQLNIGGEKNAEGAATLPLNTWSHLAATWNGSTLSLWSNGVLAGTQAVTGTLTNSTGVLRMGGDSIWNEWFAGRIDEARIYNRALTQAEIQADMSRPIRPSGPDTTPPSIAITAPNAGMLVGGNVTVTASATDDVGVTGVQFKLDGQNLGSEVTSPPFSVTWNTTTAAAGAHTLTAVAHDAAGNPATASNVQVTVDNTSPTAKVTAPSGGATLTGPVTLSANATDNVAVAGVQFKLDGTNVGAEDASSPYSISWDSTSVPNGQHVITAASRDTAGNTATSNGITVTVSNTAPPPPTGLVASYGFNEGTGTRVTDLSGNGNNGTTRGTTWTTAGKYAGAATFDGTSSWVTVNDANTLDLTTGMTLEAWVYPTALGTGWRTVIFKEKTGGLIYSLFANDSSQRALTQLNIGGELNAWGTTQLPLNTWSYIAGTWDGTTLKMWVNGVLAGTKAVTGTLANSTGVLHIGGNAIWNEWFSGRIDEIRVYNRPLSQAELQADMTTPVH
jgi:glucose/arabinose dehydrogenase